MTKLFHSILFSILFLVHRTSCQQSQLRRSIVDTNETYILGNLTTVANSDGLLLSQGLISKIIARTGELVQYTSPEALTSTSTISFHDQPDGADIFELPDGGYVYLSNSEKFRTQGGGVYGVEFDSNGNIRKYDSYLRRSGRNCNGGRTPWNTWVSCEEFLFGQCWQVDPTGIRRPQKTNMGGLFGGIFEAFAYDVRNTSNPTFYVTEDWPSGALRRYRPSSRAEMGWDMLHGLGGTLDFLEFLPDQKFRWTNSLSRGRNSAETYYQNSEGIAVQNGILAFIAKKQREMFFLDLDKFTYTVVSTETGTLPGGGTFDGQPDHVISASGGVILLSEENGATPGLFAYDGSKYISYFESTYDGDEVTGIAFSPDRRYMFFCIQGLGLLFQVSRADGEPFEARRVLKWRK